MSTNVSGNRKAIFIAVYRNVLRTGKSNRKLLFIAKRVAENGVNSNFLPDDLQNILTEVEIEDFGRII